MNKSSVKQSRSRSKFWISVLWPSFVCAGVFSGLFFAFVDPVDFAPIIGDQSSDTETPERLGGYSITFLFFWLIGASSTVVSLLILPPQAGRQAEDNDPAR